MMTKHTNGTPAPATAITLRDERQNAAAFEPNNMSEGLALAKVLVASKMVPKALTTAEAAFVVMMTGRELGLSVGQSLRLIHVFDGKPILSAGLIVGMVQRHPSCEYFQVIDSSAESCTYETKRAGSPKPTRMTFTIADAKRAGLTGKDNWTKYPMQMLQNRCGAMLARAAYPDVAAGLYDEDEIATQPQRVEYASTQAHGQPGDAVDATLEPSADEREAMFVEAIAQASTVAELKAVGRSVTQAGLDQERTTRLRGAYTARQSALTAPPPPSAPVVETEPSDANEDA